jgi:hypothetical protein
VTRDEYLAVLAAEPATANQAGAVMGECERLGLTDRDERLAVCAAMLGLDELGSVRDLTMGQAGQLVRALRSARSRGDLPDPRGDPDLPDGRGPGAELAFLIRLVSEFLTGWGSGPLT